MKNKNDHGRIENNQVLYNCDARFQWGECGELVSVIMFDTRHDRAVAREYEGIWLWGRSQYCFDVYDRGYLAGHMGWG